MLKIDLHIHTIMSGHGMNTILEYINKANENKMKVIGISDHGPYIEGTMTNRHYFRCITKIPEKVGNIRVLKGVEANIINKKGELDVADSEIRRLDYVIANIHANSDKEFQSKSENTQGLIKCINSGKIKIISHPFYTNDYPIDLEKVADEACKKNVLLEVDLAYLKGSRFDNNSKDNLKKMIEVVKKHNKKVIVNSDSHNIWELGDDSILNDKLKKEIGLTDEMIINNYPKELEKFLGVKF